ncbi:hypothetical protein JD969_01865 [Planctomycetota bacterium]|nr:hypothetical protein JD969_01865 [Planctomycetota bacterium]
MSRPTLRCSAAMLLIAGLSSIAGTQASAAARSTGAVMPKPVVYPYLVTPQDYPEYYRRDTPPTTWELYDFRMSVENPAWFVQGAGKKNRYDRLGGPVSPDPYPNGRTAGTFESLFHSPFEPSNRPVFNEAQIDQLVDRGGFLGSSGFKPFRVNLSSSSKNYRGNPDVDRAYAVGMGMLYEKVGAKLTGLKFGEADATYFNLSANAGYMFPFSRERAKHVQPFNEHLWFFADQIGYRVRGHNNDSGYHYLAKENVLTQNGSQVLNYKGQNQRFIFMWQRGVAKQYGLLSELQWSGRGWTSKLRQQYYAAYLANIAAVGTEFGLTEGSKTNKFSDFGTMVWYGQKFIEDNPNPGALQTPIAFLLDYGNGWRPAHHSNTFRIWNIMKYSRGDYQTYAHFAQAYPNFDNGKTDYYNEQIAVTSRGAQRYALADTPYGDSFDVLLTDVRQDVLNQYAVVVATGDYEMNLETVRDRIETYVSQGGQFVCTGEIAKQIWPENYGSNTTTIPARARLRWVKGRKNVTEKNAFDVLNVSTMPAGAQVLCKYRSTPVVIEYPIGQGTVTVSLSRYGTRKDAKSINWDPQLDPQKNNEFIDPLSKVKHPFVAHYQDLLDEKYKAVQLFDVGDSMGVQYMVCKSNDLGMYTIGVFNDTKTQKTFEINSHIGSIQSIEEVQLLDEFIKSTDHFYPGNTSNPGVNDDTHIAAGEVRLFRVTVNEDNDQLRTLDKLQPGDAPDGKLLATDDIANINAKIREWPSFFYFFNGFKVSGEDLRNYDKSKLIKDARWLNFNDVQFVVDARDLTDEADLLNVLDKMTVLEHATDLVVAGQFTNLEDAADDASINLHNGLPASISLVDYNNAPNMMADITVIDLDYDKWDDIYHDKKRILDEMSNTDLRGEEFEDPILNIVAVPDWKRNRMLALRGIADLKDAIADVPNFFDHFGGVMVDADYIRSADMVKVQADKQLLDDANMQLIVDFSAQMDHYSTITMFPENGFVYQNGLAYMEDVFDKMQVLGANKAVIFICASDGNSSYWQSSVTEMCNLAATRGITLCFRNRTSWSKSTNYLTEFKKTASNIKLALSTAHYPRAVYVYARNTSIDSGVILLSKASSDTANTVLHPVSATGFSSIYETWANTTSLPIVLEAEYLNDAELQADIDKMYW